MLNNKNIYKFDFGNIFKLVISYVVEFLENIVMIILTWFLVFSLENIIFVNLPNCVLKNIILKIFVAIVVLLDLFFSVLIFLPKRVILTPDKILVHRFCFPLQVTFWDIRGINDKIFYSHVEVCRKYDYSTQFGERKPFFCVNENSLVEIRTKHKSYLLPVKNYDNFICEVNKRIQGTDCCPEND